MKLTKRICDALTLPGGKAEHIAWDDDGFGLRLRRSHDGSKVLKSWTVQYRFGGRKPRVKLGDYAVLSVEQARTQARKLLGRIASGEDPQAEKQNRRDKERHTLKAAITDYLAIKRREVRPRSYSELSRYLLTGSYFKPLHNVALDQITRKDVAAQLNRISLDRSKIVAASARTALSAMFAWALTQGLCEVNPVVGTLAPKGSQPRERVLSDAEIAAIWRACGEDHYGCIIRLLILTGARRQEIGSMAWPEIDVEHETWTLAAARSKNGRAHVLPLMPAMLDVIKTVPRLASRDQLFGVRGQGFCAWAASKLELDARLGFAVPWVVHDVRRSVATRLGDLGIMPHIIEQILNHQMSGHKRGPAGTYNRSLYQREVRAALALWEDHVRALVEGTERKVLSFPS